MSFNSVFGRPLADLLVAASAATMVPAVGQLSHGAIYETIALTGEAVPGGGGAEYDHLTLPAINAMGDVVFEAYLRTGGSGPGVDSSNDSVIIGPTAGNGTALGIVLREDTPAPGAGGPNFADFISATLGDSGDLVVFSFLRNGPFGPTLGGANDEGIFALTTGPGSPASLVAREGGTAPGSSGTDLEIIVSFPVINSAGDVAFEGFLKTGSNGVPVTNGNDNAIFGPTAGAGSMVDLVAREGDLIPGEGGPVFGQFGAPVINDSGDVVFWGELKTGDAGPTVSSSQDGAIFGPTEGAGSALGVRVREGDTAPGAGGAEFSSFFPSIPAINDAGEIAFKVKLRTGDIGGLVDSSNDSAIFGPGDAAGSLLQLIARTGDIAPGTGGEVFDSLGSPGLNSMNDIVFGANLRNSTTVDNSNDSTIFFRRDGELELLLREGDLFDVDPVNSGQDMRVISGLGVYREGINDHGMLALGVGFTDGSTGIFTVSWPPASLIGDYNTDGFVSQGDLDFVLLNWGESVVPLGLDENALPGGGPFDGLVSQNELDGVLLNWGNGTPAAATAIPEPSSLATVALLAGLAGRRRRQPTDSVRKVKSPDAL